MIFQTMELISILKNAVFIWKRFVYVHYSSPHRKESDLPEYKNLNSWKCSFVCAMLEIKIVSIKMYLRTTSIQLRILGLSPF